MVVHDGKVSPEYYRASQLTLSPDGSRVAYVRGRVEGKTVLQAAVVDDQVGPECVQVREGPLFSADGRHVAYVAEAERQVRVILDGREHGPYLSANHLLFTAQGSHLVYVARCRANDQEVSAVFVDGEPGPEFSASLFQPVVHADGTLEYLALRHPRGASPTSDRILYRVKQVPAG